MKNMTKKQYETPRVQTWETESCQMLAASPGESQRTPKATTERLNEEEFVWE